MKKPSYIEGQNLTLSVAQWYGISCMMDDWDTSLGQYIADDIAGKEPPRSWHTIYGLTQDELMTIYAQVSDVEEKIRRLLTYKTMSSSIE